MSGRGKDKGKRKRRLATGEELATNISNRHKKDRKQNGPVLGMFAGLRSAAAALIGGGAGAAAQAAPNHSDSDQMGSGDDERAGGDPEDDGEGEFVQPEGFEDGDGALPMRVAAPTTRWDWIRALPWCVLARDNYTAFRVYSTRHWTDETLLHFR